MMEIEYEKEVVKKNELREELVVDFDIVVDENKNLNIAVDY